MINVKIPHLGNSFPVDGDKRNHKGLWNPEDSVP